MIILNMTRGYWREVTWQLINIILLTTTTTTTTQTNRRKWGRREQIIFIVLNYFDWFSFKNESVVRIKVHGPSQSMCYDLTPKAATVDARTGRGSKWKRKRKTMDRKGAEERHTEDGKGMNKWNRKEGGK